MRLEVPEAGADTYRLVMSRVEWPEVYALAKFALEGMTYDAKAPYVGQVFVYIMYQPRDILGDVNTHAAIAACDPLAAEVSASPGGGEAVLQLPKDQMRQLLVMLDMAAESEDQADIICDGVPDEVLHRFPDIEITSLHYAEAFQKLMAAFYDGVSLTIDRPDVSQRRTNGA